MKGIASGLFQALQRVTSVNRPGLVHGQVLSGRVIKLMPKNTAVISLGNQQVTAQLQAPVTSGKKYLFQILSLEDKIQLKILTKQSKEYNDDPKQVLDRLGVAATADNKRLVSLLVERNLPFRQSALKQASSLLHKTSDKQKTLGALLQAFEKQLPIRTGIIEALTVRQHATLSSLLQETERYLTEKTSLSNTEKALLHRLASLNGTPGSAGRTLGIASLLHQVLNGNKESFLILKETGVLPEKATYEHFQKKWIQWMYRQGSNIHKGDTAVSILNKLSGANLSTIPFDLPSSENSRIIFDLLQSRNSAKSSASPVTAKQLSPETKAVMMALLPEFPQPENLSQRISLQVKNMMLFAGLDDEMQLLKQLSNQEELQSNHSMKTLLLQALNEQQSGKSQLERMQQILHFLNGIQLTAHQDNTQMVQWSLVLPGTFMKAKDIQVNIEGRKNEKGGIDPEFCHVLFYLELGNLKETVVDMSIHHRKVFLTVYNENNELLKRTSHLQSQMEKGLEQAGFDLASIQFKKIKSSSDRVTYPSYFSESGVDLKI
ncbi:hypothetical protein GCM10007216_21620 [Thalassobacillus devorans]|uniref:Flagellar hook-length control protein FliK n=1 Tax=Thalassobacillus devorans TaxID=279813 RepID=A0ABQ1P4B7_9BACI|nr:hypothetical protein [Thalassobacillus devorans]NIK27896.1 hypothetical protein [Thalassobacillus devorans]GGC90516.1 hypothetical protein GCM10007216_21620 [Thalassobacillus devorans]